MKTSRTRRRRDDVATMRSTLLEIVLCSCRASVSPFQECSRKPTSVPRRSEHLWPRSRGDSKNFACEEPPARPTHNNQHVRNVANSPRQPPSHIVSASAQGSRRETHTQWSKQVFVTPGHNTTDRTLRPGTVPGSVLKRSEIVAAVVTATSSFADGRR